MDLGEPARKAIKGHDLDYCLKILEDSREKSLAEFRKRDDAWLMSVDKPWPWGPTNNFCKWFQVCPSRSETRQRIIDSPSTPLLAVKGAGPRTEHS